MKVKTVWKYSQKTEALRLLHAAHQIAVGFYKVNNFIVLPNNTKDNSANIVTFPFLAYNKIPRFWKKVSFIDIGNLPVKVTPDLVQETSTLLQLENIPKPKYLHTQKLWAKAESEVISEIYKIMPVYSNKIKKITIYPTAFGTGSSFNFVTKDGEIVLYLREDKGIATITEAIITSLTRADIYKDLDGIWQESEIITDWLITKTSINNVLKKYDKQYSYLPTIKGVRVKQRAKLLAESEEFYKSLGLFSNKKMFSLNGLTPEINKRPVENLSATEKVILRLLIQKAGGIISFDELGNELFKDEGDFSLYAITKSIERLRNKLEANGVSGSYIQTLRGKGYLLKN